MSILGNTIIIRDLSFYQCVSLTNIILFGANISIGFQSFSACTGLIFQFWTWKKWSVPYWHFCFCFNWNPQIRVKFLNTKHKLKQLLPIEVISPKNETLFNFWQ